MGVGMVGMGDGPGVSRRMIQVWPGRASEVEGS